MSEFKEITLPSGAVATERRVTHRAFREAQKVAKQDETLMMNAIISARYLINGATVLPEDVDDLDARDTLVLMKEAGDFLDVDASASKSLTSQASQS
jgi:hypothetical protein